MCSKFALCLLRRVNGVLLCRYRELFGWGVSVQCLWLRHLRCAQDWLRQAGRGYGLAGIVVWWQRFQSAWRQHITDRSVHLRSAVIPPFRHVFVNFHRRTAKRLYTPLRPWQRYSWSDRWRTVSKPRGCSAGLERDRSLRRRRTFQRIVRVYCTERLPGQDRVQQGSQWRRK